MKTRFFSLLVALIATTSVFAFAFKYGDLYYVHEEEDNGTTVLVWHDLEYPSNNYAGLTSVVIPKYVYYDGTTYRVTSIGEKAFGGCTSLTSITIPNSIKSIEESAFRGCTSLTSITIPHSVTSIENSAFYGCSGLTSIIVEGGNPVYDSRNNCNGIVETASNTLIAGFQITVIPNSVTSIGNSAFCDCSGLTSITIPNSVTSIGESAFYGCSGLTSATIGNGVTNIGEKAFQGCSNLETVIFGSGLQSIDKYAFEGCQNIYEMTVYATKVPNVDSYTFSGVSKLAELHVPAESVKKYKIHPVWGLFNVITAIPYTVTLLCDNVQGAVVGSGSYQPNEQVTITAKPNAGYRFVQWSDGITTNPRTLVVVSDTTLTAEFEEIPTSEYTVSVIVNPAQHGAVQITLTAVPDEGYQFAHWSDGNTENPRTILIKENMTLSATFNLSTKANNASVEDSQDGTRKVFRNGQTYIIRGEKTYTATGAQL